ncbi:pyridoxamine 5'-phosphate oxidase family protein [Nonomuraea jabiensis]|uniref:pyridoxamine 5'-phosphate oxidase family protein n=1 Tax=Nonomuraea jabiensis TaxID=882448 RepID=UPI0034346053
MTDLDAHARGLMDANLYVVLGTVDAEGVPSTSPVYFATADYAEIFWVPSPDTQHSRNLAARPRLSMVIFDSTVPTHHGRAVYLSGTATELTAPDGIVPVEVRSLDGCDTVLLGHAARTTYRGASFTNFTKGTMG